MDTLKIVFPNGDDASKNWQEVTDKIFSIGEPAVSYFIDGVSTTTFLFAAGFNLSNPL